MITKIYQVCVDFEYGPELSKKGESMIEGRFLEIVDNANISNFSFYFGGGDTPFMQAYCFSKETAMLVESDFKALVKEFYGKIKNEESGDSDAL